MSLRGILKFLIISRFFMRLRAPQMGGIEGEISLMYCVLLKLVEVTCFKQKI